MFQNLLQPNAEAQNGNTNNAPADNNPLNHGWYLVYQVILGLYAVSQLFTAIRNLSFFASLGVTSIFIYVLTVLPPLILGVSAALQVFAMRQRDFKKAQLALGGFAAYAVLYVFLVLYIAILANLDAATTASFIFQSIISLAIFCLCVGYGAFRVYTILKPRETIRAIADEEAYKTIRGR